MAIGEGRAAGVHRARFASLRVAAAAAIGRFLFGYDSSVIAALLFVISAAGSALALSARDLTFWRLVGGLAIGAASVIAPAYIAVKETKGKELEQMA
jgi:hypothetical protein